MTLSTKEPAMPNFDTLLLQLNQPLAAARGAELRVESGTVWITANGVADDLFLSAGESYRVPRAGKVVVQAVRGTARVRVSRGERFPLAAMARRWFAALPGVVVQR
jgi:hypothetical protein